MRLFEMFNLSEGRDAPLFHGTSLFNADTALRENKLAARTEHFTREEKTLTGVSLSRNMAVSENFGTVIFVLDQKKIAARHKMIPTDYWGFSPAITNMSSRRRGEFAEAEEFVVGDLANLDRYIISIKLVARYISPDQKSHYPTLFGHPLLEVGTSWNKRPK